MPPILERVKDVKRIAGNRKAWTIDGNILTNILLDMEGKCEFGSIKGITHIKGDRLG